ncbi:MAG: stage II sporulation protein R [Clostridiales bacterium]|nr:stage II sporulation protein R [Clostridiales bacterium]
MKRKTIAILLIAFTVMQIFCGCGEHTKAVEENRFLRVHVRADSDSAQAQAVKIKAVAAVERFLSRELASCKSEQELKERATELLPAITSVALSAVKSAGCGYGVRAYLGKETFPACTLGGKTYPKGAYDALVILLGTGRGDNWWSVLYPQYDSGTEYRSLIAEWFSA